MFLKNLDHFSGQITLFFNHNDKHSSIFSGILSLIYFIIIIYFSILFSLDFLLLRNPTAFFYKRFINEVGKFTLDSKGIFHFISFNSDKEYGIEIDKRAFTIIGVTENDSIMQLNNNISLYDHWIYDLCDQTDIMKLKKYFTDEINKYYSNSLCIQKFYNKNNKSIILKNKNGFNYPFLEHGSSKLNNKIYGIYIQMCQNNTEINNNNCYPTNIILEKLNSILNYGITFLESYIDVQNYNEPIQKVFHRITSEFNKNVFALNHLNFYPILVNTHSGIIFDKLTSRNSYNFNFNEKLTSNINENYIFGTFNFWMENNLNIYERSYSKVQDIAGGVDGIVEITMIVFGFINVLFSEDYIITHDINKLLYNMSAKKNLDIKINYAIEMKKEEKLKKMFNLNDRKTLSYSKINNKIYQRKSFNRLRENNFSSGIVLKNQNIDSPKVTTKLNGKNINTISQNFQKKLKSYLRYKKVNCIDFFFRVKLKWFGDSQLYLIHLLKLREKVISEENLFKSYYDIKDIKKYLHSQNKYEFPKEFPSTDKTLYKSPDQKIKHFSLNT